MFQLLESTVLSSDWFQISIRIPITRQRERRRRGSENATTLTASAKDREKKDQVREERRKEMQEARDQISPTRRPSDNELSPFTYDVAKPKISTDEGETRPCTGSVDGSARNSLDVGDAARMPVANKKRISVSSKWLNDSAEAAQVLSCSKPSAAPNNTDKRSIGSVPARYLDARRYYLKFSTICLTICLRRLECKTLEVFF